MATIATVSSVWLQKQENMPKRKKREPTIEDVRTLREQAEGYIFDVVSEFESISGLTLTGISISRKRPVGFGSKPYVEIKIETEL